MARSRKTKTKVSSSQKSFADLEESISTSEDRAGSESYFLATNHYNLLDYLSSGLIKPAAGIPKYYKDLGGYCPGYIPLFVEPPFEEIVDLFSESEATGLPIIIELNSQDLTGNGLAITKDFDGVKRENLSGSSDDVVLLLKGVIPSSTIRSIYFRTKEDLKAFDIRKYENVPDHLYSFEVSGEMFEPGERDVVQLCTALEGVAKSEEGIPAEVFTRIDSLSGALCLLGKYINVNLEIPLSVYSSVLSLILKGKTKDAHPTLDEVLDQPYGWGHLLESIFSTDVIVFIESSKADMVKGNRSTQNILLALLLNTLAATIKTDYNPDGTLDAIRSSYDQILDRILPKLKKSCLIEYDDFTRAHEEFRDGLLDIDVFLSTYPPETFPTYIALALFHVQNNPDDVISNQFFAGIIPAEIRALIALLSGTYHGRSFLYLRHLPDIALVSLIDQIAAGRFNEDHGEFSLGKIKGEFFSGEAEPLLGSGERLVFSDEVLFERHIIKAGGEDLKDSLSARFKAEKAFNDPTTHQLASEICRILEWQDLITTVVLLKDREYILQHHEELMEFRTVGFVPVKSRINQPAEFIQRVNQLKDPELEEINTLSVRLLL